MGQSQILLIILGMLVVGVMVASAIVYVTDSAITGNRDSISSDLIMISVKARQDHSTPRPSGGGGGSFTGLAVGAAGVVQLVGARTQDNDNGTYTVVSLTQNSIVLRGVGKVQIDLTTYPTVEFTVSPSGQVTTIMR